MIRLTIATLVLSGIMLAPAIAQPLAGDEPLKMGTENGIGPLASPAAYKTIPLGSARLFGGDRPDVFTNANRGVECALYLYRWLRNNERGQPVFAAPVKVKHPFGNQSSPDGVIFQTPDGTIHGYWLDGGKLVHCLYDRTGGEFKKIAELDIRKGLSHGPGSVAIINRQADRLELIVTCSNGGRYRPPGNENSDDYVLYDGAGVFRGQWPYAGLYGLEVKSDLSAVLTPPHLLSHSREEIRGGDAALAPIVYESAKLTGVIAAAGLGNLYLFPYAAGDVRQLGEKRALFNPDAYSIRHPTVGATPIVYPNAQGQAVDLMVGGEGALFYYRFTGKFSNDGHPVYDAPEPVWQENATLFAGTLPVPNVVDWDGDGASDLIVGNSEGLVLFFKNHGSDREPRFGVGEPLRANGEIIHVQPGYYGIQGPFETRWGYTCPAIADWNGDGLPDILLSGATARHEVLVNIGTRTQPKLAAPRSVFFDGLELHGSWRVRPGVTKIDGRMAYIIQDDANALHLYWRIDDYNVEDGGQLRLTNGKIITSHITNAAPGQKGRAKIEIVDWDGDGKLDLFVGSAKRGSFPEPDIGLPWARRRKGANLQVVFFRNVGSNAKPVYEYPKQLQFRSQDTYHGAHANSPAVCNFGDPGGKPNLLIGMESGRIYFYRHDDVTFLDATKSGVPMTQKDKSDQAD